MKIKYIHENILFEDDNVTCIPRIGDMIYLDEIFFVGSVVWYPVDDSVRVELLDELPRKAKVAEAKESNVNLNDIKQAKDDSAKALKETSKVKRELVSVRQYLKSTQESKK